MQNLLTDLDNCQKTLIGIKANYQPMYRNLLLFWTKRREQLKKSIEFQSMLFSEYNEG